MTEPVESADPARRRRGDRVADRFARRFGDTLRAGDPAAASGVIDEALNAGMDPAAIHARVIAPSLHWIGTLWENGAITVADEHLATAVCQHVLARLFPGLLQRAGSAERPVLVASVQGEQHVLGLRMAADVLEGAGFDVRFLGADVPVVALFAWVVEHEPAVVALGVTMPLGVRAAARALQNIYDHDPSIGLLVGGQGVPAVLRQVPGLVYAPDSERIVDAVHAALASPAPLQLPPELTTGGVMGGGSPGGVSASTGIGTFAAQMARSTEAAADTARKSARVAFTLGQLAFRDPLTGLANRRAFEDRFLELLENVDAGPLGLLMIDVDDFKPINDTLGHDAGDRVLTDLALCISRAVRPGDLVARLGGDEFAVLLPRTAAQDVVGMGERIRSLIEQEMTDPPVRISVGATVAGDDPRRARIAADRALYDAKGPGGNRVNFTPGEF